MTLSHYLVLGLTLGDEGKAGIVDLLASRSKSSTVIRFAADPHSAHYLVTPQEEVVTFGQIGSGMINKSCRTHIGHDTLLRLPSLMVEVDELKSLGVSALERLTIDPETILVLPWHVLAERVLEISRGTHRLGTSGSGTSCARQESIENSAKAVRVKHIFEGNHLLDMLSASYSKVMERVTHVLSTREIPTMRSLVKDFTARFSIESVAYDLIHIGAQIRDAILHDEAVLKREVEETLIFEGTQGLLLNPNSGLRPYVSACDSSKRNAEAMIQRGENLFPLKKIGVMRSYATRFGAGPLVTEDFNLTEVLPELHNGASPWSGEFRAGDLDLITTRYALRASGGIDAIALNHLDRVGMLPEVKVCTTYEYLGSDLERVQRNFSTFSQQGRLLISDIRAECRIEEVTELLFDMKPAEYQSFSPWGEWTPCKGWEDIPNGLRMFLDFLQGEKGLHTPIAVVSFGVHRADKYVLRTL
jgi:adenylosuccinate synthase